MAKFKFYLENQKDEHEMVLDYDNETSELRYENGDIVVPQDVFKNFKPFFKMDEGKRMEGRRVGRGKERMEKWNMERDRRRLVRSRLG